MAQLRLSISPGFKVRILAALFVLVSCTALVIPAYGDSYPDPPTQRLLKDVQADLFNEQYQKAYASLDSLIEVRPQDPIGYLFKAGAYVAEMTDAEEDLYPVKLRLMADTAMFLARKRLDSAGPKTSAWMYLIIGHARAYESLWESRFGSFTSALSLGFKAKSAYQNGLNADSSVYDLYGGLGMYHYWKSAKAGLLRFLGIFSNDKQKGINELYLTIDSSLISAAAARNALIYIWLDRKEYDSVITICNEMLGRYPNGKLFLWPKAEAYFANKQYAQAADAYRQLRARLSDKPGNYFNLVQCDYKLYQCYEKLNEADEAQKTASRLTSYYNEIPEETLKRQRSKIGYLDRRAKAETEVAGY